MGEGGDAETIAAALRDAGVVAEFAHLHPWKANPELVGGGEPDREIVWVDAALDEERLWRESYSKACRKNLNRAEREGVTVREAGSEADIAAFHRIYIGTMERNEAAPGYYFDRDYFQAIFEEMPGSARFALAWHEGEVVAATLYLHDADDVYSYLGGADHDHQQLRPTNAVVHETIRWAREQGKRRLILGGGYRPDDGIFRFKASFSPERATLRLARRIHLQDDYDALVGAWRERHRSPSPEPSSYFPLYRARP
jgi:lipid II:glycine glycyltransferase (peptidoglycan interpeptide bridge formation enzyme)